jgi:plastocyanin
MNIRRSISIILLSLAMMLMVACSSQPAPKTHNVVIDGFKFQPTLLMVNVGDTVVFNNQDMVPHNAVAEGKFDSGKLEQGKSWTYTAKDKGTFNYICTYHPNMKGQLIVQ